MATKRKSIGNRKKAINICKEVDTPIKEQIETLTLVVISLQEKLESNLEKYINEPLCQEVIIGKDEEGNEKLKKISNPFVAEYRATLKDFSTNLVTLSKLLNVEIENKEELNELDNIIQKIRVVK